MCGICGVYACRSRMPVEASVIEGMCRQIVHRGPDEQGIFVEGPVGMGMRRLSIIDVDGGTQPMFNRDRSVCVVYNGEIYNFRELRADLRHRGYEFTTECDTEVIVHLYEEYGVDFISKLNGMFAIALWDHRAERFLLARDRLGQKPLYYTWNDEGLVFGSELKCLAECDRVDLRLNHEAVYHYFTLGYIPQPLSIYRDVFQLPPACRMIVERGQTIVEPYWQLESQVDRQIRREEVKERLRDLLTDAVRLRMISDVPLGAFLSGGVDSSITVALMAQLSSEPIKTFHIDFAESEYSEREYARAIAERYQTDHHELVVRPSAVDLLDDLVASFDEPFGDSSAVPTYCVSKLTREYVTVALAGDGGDESFGGYTRYQRILARRNLPNWFRAGLGHLGNAIHHGLPRTAPGRRYFRSLGMDNHRFFAVGTSEIETRELLSPDFLEPLGSTSTFELLRPYLEGADASDPLSPYCRLDTHRYLTDDILTKVDRMSMANSLELRSPFLDYRVVELAATLPHDWKIQNGHTKIILKETFADDLPAKVVKARKRGFSMPMNDWLRNELRPGLEAALHDSEVEASGIFQMEEIRSLAREHFAGRRDRESQLWRFLFFTRWWHQHQSRQERQSYAAESIG